MQKEEWRPCPDFPNYSASNLGRIRRDTGFGNPGPPRIMNRETKRYKGYPRVRTSIKGHASHHLVHRMVANAWLGPRPENMTVDHIDENKENAAVSNLRYVTPRENLRASHRSGTRAKSMKRALTDDQARAAYWRVRNGERQKDVAENVGISSCMLGHILRGRAYRHLGLESWTKRNYPAALPSKRKLSDKQAESLLRDWKLGMSGSKLARIYGVTVHVVQGIVCGTAYRELGGDRWDGKDPFGRRKTPHLGV